VENENGAPGLASAKVEQVKALLTEAAENAGIAREGKKDRPGVQAGDVREDNGGSSELDQSEPDGSSGVPDGTEGSQEEPAGEPVTIAGLAEHLGVEPADVYELDIPIGDGVTVTLGQLKDEYKQYGPVREATQKIQEDRSNFERSVLATRAELNAIMTQIPEQFRESVINGGRAHQAQWEKEQEKLVLEAIPEWADPVKRATARLQLIEDGAEYGFSEHEITFTQDARTLRMLADFSRFKRELMDAKAAAKRVPGAANAPAKSSTEQSSKRRLAQAIAKAKADPTIQGKAAVISQLIRGQRHGNN
jgi:hypothetical protein